VTNFNAACRITNQSILMRLNQVRAILASNREQSPKNSASRLNYLMIMGAFVARSTSADGETRNYKTNAYTLTRLRDLRRSGTVQALDRQQRQVGV
jgi:hypothetical protein